MRYENVLSASKGSQAIIEDDYDHPVDLSTSNFGDAGDVAGAFLAAWHQSPGASDAELVEMAWEEEERRWQEILGRTDATRGT